MAAEFADALLPDASLLPLNARPGKEEKIREEKGDKSLVRNRYTSGMSLQVVGVWVYCDMIQHDITSSRSIRY